MAKSNDWLQPAHRLLMLFFLVVFLPAVTLVFLGVRPSEGPSEPLHSSRMRIDEEAMPTGIALHAAIALRWLAQHTA